ncbi:sensor histidine kinase [Streptacidiphilus carbonis]|uniref:sensor histidine kinase n=1 Tax=Streptacidiphilus carbonis TaxID=105422 RepID=UPI0005AA47C5|nr:HAMP domain-containing sensor histidine kinase [Streptacidiphilus carbonis]
MTARGAGLTIRTRLTLIYGVSFTLAVTLLSVGVYLLTSTVLTAAPTPAVPATGPAAGSGQTSDTWHGVLLSAVVALVFGMAVASVLGWTVAGRMLAPIRRITAVARETASHDLQARVALDGPQDEIKELADTFDTMLARLERTFQAQRRFAANASHELLTPLTISRTLLEVAAATPGKCDVGVLTDTLLAINSHSEHLVDTLLDLARAEHGIAAAVPADLAAAAETALAETRAEAKDRDLAIEVRSAPVRVDGDPALLERLAVNLLRNAVRHNHDGGRVLVHVVSDQDGPVLAVSNTGPEVPAGLVDGLFEPFVRAAPRTRGSSRDSHGLGMAIIRAVTEAHHGTVTAQANPGGGLTVSVRFPAPSSTER